MRQLSSFLSSSACASALALFASNAAAHIELLDPPPRYSLPSNKACPCGDGAGNRTCNTTAAQSTDPNRSTNVTTFEAGSTITITAEEYINHDGRMRVAFDPEGADLADFNQNILHDEADPNEPSGRMWEFEVTLPSTPCESCTLQVIQVMNGNTTTPVMDPAPMSTYYSCADIRLVAPGTPLEGGGSGGSGSALSAGGSGSDAAGSSMGGSATGAAASSGSTDDAADEADDTDDGGCALQPGSVNSSWIGLLAALGLLGARTLRRRQRDASARG